MLPGVALVVTRTWANLLWWTCCRARVYWQKINCSPQSIPPYAEVVLGGMPFYCRIPLGLSEILTIWLSRSVNAWWGSWSRYFNPCGGRGSPVSRDNQIQVVSNTLTELGAGSILQSLFWIRLISLKPTKPEEPVNLEAMSEYYRRQALASMWLWYRQSYGREHWSDWRQSCRSRSRNVISRFIQTISRLATTICRIIQSQRGGRIVFIFCMALLLIQPFEISSNQMILNTFLVS